MSRFSDQPVKNTAQQKQATRTAATHQGSTFQNRLDQLLHKQALKQGIKPQHLQGLLQNRGSAQQGAASLGLAGLMPPTRIPGAQSRTLGVTPADLMRLHKQQQSTGRGGPGQGGSRIDLQR